MSTGEGFFSGIVHDGDGAFYVSLFVQGGLYYFKTTNKNLQQTNSLFFFCIQAKKGKSDVYIRVRKIRSDVLEKV
ncbi:hypothetical protein SAMN05444487_11448 [Marininema mesophilum]|uniref:Uncharacterized protein n=1 Tax=Marininema mesophilum TaxID=1048340 RepID=A0A1H3ATX4_9BACL|nr:hypothetical protein [Marininema mesophilum]SDX32841.1 hypothetical protein SAMN05444487_11448 [Marininema mesophilum]